MGDSGDNGRRRLTDFEYVTYRDDTMDHPMVMVLRIHIEGTLQTAVFKLALQQALHHHPLLRSKVMMVNGDLFWQAEESSPTLTVSDFSEPLDANENDAEGETLPEHCPQVRFDLTKECGAAFELRCLKRRNILVCHFHHACVDGVGAIRFLADVFAIYGAAVASEHPADGQDIPEFVAPDPQLLAQRGDCPEFGAQTGARKSWREWLRGPSRFLLGSNYRIPRMSTDNHVSSTRGDNVLHTAVLHRATVRKLKKLAATRGVSTNDLCMLVYLQQIAQWTQRHRQARDRDLFRVLMPVSLRTPDLDQIPAANVLSYVFQTFKRRHCRNSEALLSRIHQRSSNMLQNNEAAIFLKLFRLVRRFPFLLHASRLLQPAFATAVLANVGELKRIFGRRFPLKQGRIVAGDVIIRRVDGIAPLRRNTNIAVSFGGYGGELILNLRANPECLSSDEAKVFLQRITDRLIALAETQTISAGRQVENPSFAIDSQTPAGQRMIPQPEPQR